MDPQRFFENFMLGVTQVEVAIEERDLNIAAVHKLTSSAVHNINIMTRSLDHQVFDRIDILEAVNTFIHRNRNSALRILLIDSSKIIHNGHRLLNLADKAPSKIAIKKLPKESLVYNESFMTADGKGFLHNPQSDRYEGTVNFNDITRCTELDKIFTDNWHQSEAVADLRRVSI